MKLPIMQPQLSSTRNLMMALAHFLDFLLLTCGQMKFKESARLKAEIFDPLKQRANQEEDSFSEKKNDLDAILLERLPPPTTMQAAVRASMIDLHRVV